MSDTYRCRLLVIPFGAIASVLMVYPAWARTSELVLYVNAESADEGRSTSVLAEDGTSIAVLTPPVFVVRPADVEDVRGTKESLFEKGIDGEWKASSLYRIELALTPSRRVDLQEAIDALCDKPRTIYVTRKRVIVVTIALVRCAPYRLLLTFFDEEKAREFARDYSGDPLLFIEQTPLWDPRVNLRDTELGDGPNLLAPTMSPAPTPPPTATPARGPS
jgi:hypothetical protein